ncbi:MAG TPA: hypothetical protein VGF77_08560 [Allosphingosinicella sp.]|jgi:hypothetical protein
MLKQLLCTAPLLLTACATTAPPADHIVTREVPVPYYQPCPKAADIPAPPKSVHEEHPTMPEAADKAAVDQLLGASAARERILAGKVLEYRTYAERADAILHACADPPRPPH